MTDNVNTVTPTATALGSGSSFTHISQSRKTTNTMATVLVYATMALAMVPLVWVLWTVIARGISPILNAAWWTESQASVLYHTPGGGAAHAIVGTLMQTAIA